MKSSDVEKWRLRMKLLEDVWDLESADLERGDRGSRIGDCRLKNLPCLSGEYQGDVLGTMAGETPTMEGGIKHLPAGQVHRGLSTLGTGTQGPRTSTYGRTSSIITVFKYPSASRFPNPKLFHTINQPPASQYPTYPAPLPTFNTSTQPSTPPTFFPKPDKM